MATVNPFDLLADDDNDDPSRLMAIQQQKVAAKKPFAPAPTAVPAAKLPSKPIPPAQAVREARSNATPISRGGASRGGIGRGRGGRGGGTAPTREFGNGVVNGFSRGYGGGLPEEGVADKPSERERGGYGSQRPSFRGGRRGGYASGNGEGGADPEQFPRRMYERRSGTGRGYEVKREGAGHGNWGTADDDLIAQMTKDRKIDENLSAPREEEEDDGPKPDRNAENKESPANESEEKEPDDKEMTLEEYQKVKEEKRKTLLAMKPEERKVEKDKDFATMQQLSSKKGNDEFFVKLGSDKDAARRKDTADRDERIRKSVTITQFLKPAEGERYYQGRGRGRGRGRGDPDSFRSDFGGRTVSSIPAPSIEDPRQFPALS